MGEPKTAFVVVSDQPYFSKAKRTVEDLRWRGQWEGDIVYIAIGFYPSQTWSDFMKVQIRHLPAIDVSEILKAWSTHPIKPMPDNRHTTKMAQWNKLYVFDTWFSKWDRIVYLDAGMRVLHSVTPLLNLPWKNAFLAPDNSGIHDNTILFETQIDRTANPTVTKQLENMFGAEMYTKKFFINCIWVYDTQLLDKCNITHLLQGMNQFPICMTNEMALLNLYFTYLHNVWIPFPEHPIEGKYLYGWCELCYSEKLTWRDFHFIKYPVTISINCD